MRKNRGNLSTQFRHYLRLMLEADFSDNLQNKFYKMELTLDETLITVTLLELFGE